MQTPENFAVIYMKFKKKGQPNLWVFRQEDTNGIANSGDHDQTASLGHCLPRPICPKTFDHYSTSWSFHII